MSESDLELLNRYTRDHDEKAFADLIHRHVNLVFSAALRQVRSPQLAEEVSQSVFIDLTRKAPHLAPNTTLSAWLYQVTHRTAIDVVRREARRQAREQIAVEMNAINAPNSDWMQIESTLDEAMQSLDETDRTAVILRYFENKSLREVGQSIGSSDDAAQKRVSRAVEQLRDFFSKRGIAIGASGLAATLGTHAVQAAPAGLAASIFNASGLAGATLSATTATKVIAMTILQKSLITAALLAAIGAGFYETQQASNLRSQVSSLQTQQSTLAKQLDEARQQNEKTTKNLTELQHEQSLSK